jgi:TRAP-type transport system periplasmic protein
LAGAAVYWFGEELDIHAALPHHLTHRGNAMKRNVGGTRRGFLAILGASPLSLASIRSEAQPKQLKLSTYSWSAPVVEGGRIFADKLTENSAGAIQLSVERELVTVPFQAMNKASALASYSGSEFADVEPILGLSTLPMLTATFDEAETLARIARPYYNAALTRHGQILLAIEPWQPAALWSTFPIRSNANLKSVSFALSSPLAERWGWKRTLMRLGASPASYSNAELVISSGYEGSLQFTQEFAYLMDKFFAVPVNFLTASREVFDALTEAQRQELVDTGRDTELALWKYGKELWHRNVEDIAPRGVAVAASPSDVLATLRMAAEPDIQGWAQSIGADGATILIDYRRAIEREQQ